MLNKPITDFDNGNFGHGQAEIGANAGSKEFIGQYPDVLGIVAEFDNPKTSIGGAHEMRLRPTAHSLNLLDSFYDFGNNGTGGSLNAAKLIGCHDEKLL